MRARWFFPLMALLSGCATVEPAPPRGESVLVLHGLGRGPASMSRMAKALERAGYEVHNVGYPSRSKPIDALVADHIAPAFAAMPTNQPMHVVAHSLGGILALRQAAERPATVRRMVLLAPPLGGSELVDELGGLALYRKALGPAFPELGTGPGSAPNQLPPPDCELGVIAGAFSWNPVFSALIEGPDDGKVSVARAKGEGVKEMIVVPHSHTWMMNRRRVIDATLHFLAQGRFPDRQAP